MKRKKKFSDKKILVDGENIKPGNQKVLDPINFL